MREKKAAGRRKWDAGILPSFLLFLAEIVILAVAIVLSYRAHGEAGLWIALFALALLAAAVAGIVVSARAIRRRSEPAGWIRLLCALHVVQLLLVFGLYGLGAAQLLAA